MAEPQTVLTRKALPLILLFAATAFAEDAKAKAAREELERQLTQMVGKQPTKVRVDFIGLEDPNYKIEEASFELDGRSLRTPPLAQLSDEGTHLIWNGDVTPGKHTVKVLLVFANHASVVLSDEGGYKWKVSGDVSFDVNSGIEVQVQVTPKRDDKQAEVAKRFKLALPAKPVMIATLDDGKMPDAPPKPIIAVVDAGVPAPTGEQLADKKKDAAQKAAEVAEAKRLAAEAKKQKAADALAAKEAAAEAKREKVAAALAAKQAAAETKKEKAAAALAAQRAAADAKKEKAAIALAARQAAEEEKRAAAAQVAEEKQRLAQAAIDAKNPPPVAVVELPVDAGVPEAVVEVVDAAAPPAVVAAPVDAGVAAPVAAAPVAEEEGPPWLMIAVAGGVGALIFLILFARRRSRPPTLDD